MAGQIFEENDQSFDLVAEETAQSFDLAAEGDEQSFEMSAEDVVMLDDVSKVRVADIVNDLTTDEPKKPLSAAQGVVLFSAICALEVDMGEADGKVLEDAKKYADERIANIQQPDVNAPVAAHDVDENAHRDIRAQLAELGRRFNVLANADDEILNQMAEVVEFIRDDRDLIQQITTGKVSVADIVDNLTTNVSNKPLSAAQGVALKGLIDKVNTALNGKLSTSAMSTIISETKNAVQGVYAFPAYNSPMAFGCLNGDTLTRVVSRMPNNCDCHFWINDSQFPTIYKEIRAKAMAEGATDGYGPVIIQKRNSLANVEWRHYKSMLTLGRRWSKTNNYGWSGGWIVLQSL